MLLQQIRFLFTAVLQIVLWKILRSDLERQLLLVLKENQILKRRRKRVQLTPWDKEFYMAVSRRSKRLLDRIVLVKPETVLSWHRKFIEMKWFFRSPRIGRPPLTWDIRQLIIEMKITNPRWGVRRIFGELRKLGFRTCHQSVANVLREAGIDPYPRDREPGISWKNFMKSQGRRVFACDFFCVDTIFGKRFDVFFIIDVATREIISHAVTYAPTTEWLKNIFRSVFAVEGKSPDILISDRDQAYGIYEIWARCFPAGMADEGRCG